MKIKKYVVHILLTGIIFILLLFSMRVLQDIDNIFYITNFTYMITCIIIWICQYLIFKGLTNNTKVSIYLVVLLEILYDIINYIVRKARGSAITISDTLSIKTAYSVAGNLSLSFDKNFLYGLLLLVVIVGILILFRNKFIEDNSKKNPRIIKILIGCIVFFVITKTNIYSKYSLWDINEAYRTLGTPVTILRMLYEYNIKEPDGYNKKEIEEIIANYGSIETASINEEKDTPNIIVIINESFSDYYKVYNEGEADPLEYFRMLSNGENVISGTVYSSEFGGQTSNVEYEFLTQNSTRILPIGSNVFQQYILEPIETSIVQTLKSQGYRTCAIHPWDNYAYSRNKIYKLFGFETLKFKNDIDGLEESFNNEFISDRSTYRELIKDIREKKKDEKLFEYVLTVQNHTGFTNPDPKQITYSNNTAKNVYMQLIHESEQALKEVIEELIANEEKYILLFFGDHQPNLDGSDNMIQRTTKEYEVPFIIWANYDIKEEYDVKTSTIFLQNLLLKEAKIQYSSMNSYMENLKKYYPVITKRFYMDENENCYKTGDNTSENYYKLEEYDKIIYYQICK